MASIINPDAPHPSMRISGAELERRRQRAIAARKEYSRLREEAWSQRMEVNNVPIDDLIKKVARHNRAVSSGKKRGNVVTLGPFATRKAMSMDKAPSSSQPQSANTRVANRIRKHLIKKGRSSKEVWRMTYKELYDAIRDDPSFKSSQATLRFRDAANKAAERRARTASLGPRSRGGSLGIADLFG